MIGIVREVFTLNDYQKIGFKIEVNNEVIEIIQDIDDNNINILKYDKVKIIRQVINNKEFIDIEKIEEEYE